MKPAKALSILLSIMITISQLIVPARAQSSDMNTSGAESSRLSKAVYEDYEYTVTDNTVTITKYNGIDYQITIPDTINEMPVTAIGDFAFSGAPSLTEINISENIASIGMGAFGNCPNLTSLTVSSSNAYFRSVNGIVYNDNYSKIIAVPGALTSVSIPYRVTSIGEDSFYGCTRITELVIPEGVETIERYAFYGCTGLESISLPQSLKDINEWAFYNCSSLKTVIYSSNAESWTNINISTASNDNLLNAEIVYSPDVNVYFDNSAYNWKQVFAYVYDDNDPMSAVRMNASWPGVLMTQVNSEGYLTLNVNNFRNGRILFSESNYYVTGSYLYYDSDRRYPADSEPGLPIGGRSKLFSANYSWTNHEEPDKATSGKIRFDLGDWNHSDSIGFYIWARKGDKLLFGSNNGWVETDNWGSKKLLGTPVEGEDGIVESYSIDYLDGWDHFVIFNDYTTGLQTYDCVFTKDAFGKTAHLTGKELENPIDSSAVGIEADFDNIAGCGPYMQITSTGNLIGRIQALHDDGATVIAKHIFKYLGKIDKSGAECCTHQKVSDAIAAYHTVADDVWTRFTKIEGYEEKAAEAHAVIFGETAADTETDTGTDTNSDTNTDTDTKSDPDYEYSINNDNTVTITKYKGSEAVVFVPDTINGKKVTAIGEESFSGNNGLISVTVSEGITQIDQYAFYNCSSLTSVSLPASTVTVGVGIFSDCPSLTKIGVDSDNPALTVYDDVLYDKSSNELVKCPTNKDSVEILSGTASIGPDAFSNCKSLKVIRIPSGVTFIDKWAFDGCSGLTKVYLPASVCKIDDKAFDKCTALTDVYYEGINKDSFFDSIDVGQTNECLINANFTYKTVSGKIRFDMGSWNHSDNICFYVWARTKDQAVLFATPNGLSTSDTWGSKQLFGTPVEGEDGIVESYYIDYMEDYDYFVIFNDYETNEQTYDCVFTKDAFGKTAFMTGLELENPVVSEKTNIEADFNNVPGCGPYLQITSTGNIIGYAEAKYDDAPALVAKYIFKQMGVITLAGKEACTPEKVAYAISAYDTTADEVWAKFQKIEGHEEKDAEAYRLIYKKEIETPTNTDSDYEYTVQEDETVMITGYNGNDSDVTIPSLIDNKPVSVIGDSAFNNNSALKSVTIPNTVNTIGNNAFNGCTGLTTVSIPDSVTMIDRNAFYGCSSLDSIEIPASVKTIGSQAFFDCTGLASLTIPNGVESIGGNAFYGCTKLQSVSISQSVTEIGENAFCRCSQLNSFTVNSSNSVFTVYGGALYNNNTKTLIKCPVNASSVDIAADTLSIAQMAFQDCSGLTEITFPENLTTIGKWAFQNCINITKVTIPVSVVTVNDDAFYDCDNLRNVYYEGTEEQWNAIKIGADNDPLKKAALHFPDDNLVTYYFLAPNAYLTDSNSVGFYYWIPSENAGWPGLEMTPAPEIGKNIFKCRVPDNSSTIAIIFNSFDNSMHQTENINLEGYVKGNSELYETRDNFYDMIFVINSQQDHFAASTDTGEWFSIDPSADNYYKNYLDNSGEYYIIEKPSDTSTTTDTDTHTGTDTNTQTDTNTGTDTSGTDTTHTDTGSDTDTSETDTETDTDIPPQTNPGDFYWFEDEAGNYISAYTGSDTVITIPSEIDGHPITTVKRTEKKANAQAAKITKIYVSDGITTIGKYAFKEYTALEEIILPDSVTTIGNEAFYDCKKLKKIVLPKTVTIIDPSAFNKCESLTEITIPGSVKKISNGAFGNCTGLIDVEIEEGVETIDTQAFFQCTSLTSIKIPESVTSIGQFAFSKCKSLKDVYFGGSEDQWNTLMLNTGSDNPALTNNAAIHFTKNSAPKDFLYKDLNDGTIEITYYAGSDSVVNIPTEIDGKKVTVIGSSILVQGDIARDVLEIIVPDTVTTIADNAFALCQTLEKVTIPSSVTIIGNDIVTDYGNIKIYCATDSEAHKYAAKNGISFILTDEDNDPVKLGDVDGDGKISAKDSMMIQRYAINLKKLTPKQIRAADIDGDGRATNKDAINLLRYTINIKVKFAIGEMV